MGVHVEKIAVALFHGLAAQSADGFGKVEIDATAGFAHAKTFVAGHFRGSRGDIARGQITITGIAALEVIVAFGFRNLSGRTFVALLLGNPHAAVVAERFGHQREFFLVLAMHRNAGRVDLRIAGIGEASTAAIGPPSGSHIAAGGVRGQVIDVRVTARRQHNRVSRVARRFCRRRDRG